MRISDWSSDVCSSDLAFGRDQLPGERVPGRRKSPTWASNPIDRRQLLAGLAAASALGFLARPSLAEPREVRFGLTPVFLSSDLELLTQLKAYLSGALERPVTLVTRRTYQEITALLLSGQLDAA